MRGHPLMTFVVADAVLRRSASGGNEIGRMREVAEQRQRDAVTAGSVLAALAIGQLIGKIAGLDWDIRVAEVRIFDERDKARQQALVAAERDRFDLELAELRQALGDGR